jgi:hypothetical protein
MKDPSKPLRPVRFFHSTTPLTKWSMFNGPSPGLTRKVAELLREQINMLEAKKPLSAEELDCYDARSEQICELIRLLQKG